LNIDYHIPTQVNGWLTFVIMTRYTPSQADVHVFKAISSAPDASTYPHTARWYTHIKSYAAEHGSLAGSSTAGEAFTGGVDSTPAVAAEDEDEVDLFGDDEEEDAEAERVKAERVAAYNLKKAAKPKTIAKVCINFFTMTSHKHICRAPSLTGIFLCSLWSPSR
jgi:Eukaryotic elongation factor 1 beta central acidic region